MASMSLPVYDKAGNKVEDWDFDPTEIASSINKQLLHDAVVMYQANLRQGTFATKSRSEVAGSTAKLYRQKGTGRARAGSRRSGTRKGGGHIFAKKPRDFSYRLPRKALQIATRMAIASKVTDDQIRVLSENLSFEAPKTKDLLTVLKAMGIAGQTAMVATDGLQPNVYLSGRNLEGVEILPSQELNAYRVLKPRYLVITKSLLEGWKASASASKEEVASS
ncbi:LSU ribosomal protein L4P [Planctomycetales bacterium 10988]|nr:LSU ribosomal protein L4P [Planctomycetales bacterium 10988]